MNNLSIALLVLTSVVSDAQPQTSTDYTFLGNYKDTFDRTLTFQYAGTSFTPATCYEKANTDHYNYFGLQYGGECRVGNNLTLAERYGVATDFAATPCNADTTITCGGGLVNSLYKVNQPYIAPTSQPTVKPPTSKPVTMAPTVDTNYLLVGDYIDNADARAFSYRLTNDIEYTPETCYNQAYISSYRFFGLQYGVECWAGNNLTTAEQYGTTTATMTCSADPTYICGGPLINTVYKIKVPYQVPTITPTRTPTYKPSVSTDYLFVGDFTDVEDPTARAFPLQLATLGATYTPETCYSEAAAKNYNYFGLQFGGECWVGNDLTSAERYGAKAATMTCTSDANFMCGGPIINSIYRVKSLFYSFTPTTEPTDVPSSKPSVEPTSIHIKVTFEPTIFKTKTPTETPTYKPSMVPTVVPSTVPSAKPSVVTDYLFVGDFGDVNNETARAFQVKLLTLLEYTPATCYDEAVANKYNYFGLQYGGECWVGNDLVSAERYGTASATMPCTADSNFMCGGPNVNSIYRVKNPFYSYAPTTKPSESPTCQPSSTPTYVPSTKPTVTPSFRPSTVPSLEPSYQPSTPTETPTIEPSTPSVMPTDVPSVSPTIATTTNTNTVSPSNSAILAKSSSSTTPLSSGAYAGIAASLFVVLCVCFPVLFLLCCVGKNKEKEEKELDFFAAGYLTEEQKHEHMSENGTDASDTALNKHSSAVDYSLANTLRDSPSERSDVSSKRRGSGFDSSNPLRNSPTSSHHGIDYSSKKEEMLQKHRENIDVTFYDRVRSSIWQRKTSDVISESNKSYNGDHDDLSSNQDTARSTKGLISLGNHSTSV